MKIYPLFISIIILSFSAFANPPEVTEVDREIIHHIFDGNYEKADSLLEAQIALHPDHPKYYALKSHAVDSY